MDKSKFKDLPTHDFIDEIIEAVNQNQVTILTAETGAGKSSQVPQYLAENGYNRVIVTQPRILAARNLSRRVREEWSERNSEDASKIIGYRTAHERDDSGNTKILYCTDGLQMVRELTGSGTLDGQILVLDEVHEWNENMEVLVAWAKKRALENPKFKILIMSATFDVDKLADYFTQDLEEPAVLKIPGRYFEVKNRMGKNLLNEIFTQIENPGRNILVFLPGKSEIRDVSEAISPKAAAAGIEIIPLHAQLEIEEQQRAFGSYPNGKIILSTNIAQTSVTIDDIDMVIDSGLERRSEVRNGVEGLFIAQISQADCSQRAGRAGRTKPGEYVLAAYDKMECLPFEERAKYSTPEIMRKHLDRLVLRLASINIDIEMLDFYHSPSKTSIKRAKKTLRALGAIDNNGEITNLGRQMEKFPVSSKYARMLVEAEKYDQSLKAKLATIIAIQEVDGIVKGGATYTGWRKLTKKTKSDLLAQHDVFLAIQNDQVDPEKYEDYGIIFKNIIKAREVETRLLSDLGVSENRSPIKGEEAENLMKVIISGQVDQLWQLKHRNNYENIQTGDIRELSSGSVVKNAKLIAAEPFDLEVPLLKGGTDTLNLIQNVTVVRSSWLLDLAPHNFSLGKKYILYDPRLGSLASRQQIIIGKKAIDGSSQPILEDTPANRQLFRREFAIWATKKIEAERRNLINFYGQKIPAVSQAIIERELAEVAPNIVSLDQLDQDRRKYVISLSKIETYFDDNFWNNLARKKPKLRGNRQRKFGKFTSYKRNKKSKADRKPKHKKSWVEYRRERQR